MNGEVVVLQFFNEGLATQPASRILLQTRVRSSLLVATSELPCPKHQTSGNNAHGEQHLLGNFHFAACNTTNVSQHLV